MFDLGRGRHCNSSKCADEFHELLPNSDLFWLKKCGHAAMMEHPEKFNEIVIQWLSDKNIA